MPKERRPSSASSEIRHKASSPYRPNPSSQDSISPQDTKEWDEVRCPICMEHPHNAVILLCSSHDKGCRPFICDTSYRHSNCLDQYCKSVPNSSLQDDGNDEQQRTLSCPLCRGLVTGWTVRESARSYMNAKSRNCSKESCGFAGAYGELRRHARKEHPSVRPVEADPIRQQEWDRMERREELANLRSMLSGVGNRYRVRIRIGGGDEEVFVPSVSLVFVAELRAGEDDAITDRGSRAEVGQETRRLFVWREGFGDVSSVGGTRDEPVVSYRTFDGYEDMNGEEEEARRRGSHGSR